MFHHVQVTDTLKHILDLLVSGIWVMSLEGPRIPLSVLGEPGGRCYAVRTRKPEEEKKRHDYIMAQVAPRSDIVKWIALQARDDSEFKITYLKNQATLEAYIS